MPRGRTAIRFRITGRKAAPSTPRSGDRPGQALECRIGRFIIAFDDGDAVSFHAFQQRAYVRRHCGFEAGMQERGRLDIRDRAQRKVEAVCVPDNDRAVRILLGGGRVEAEVSRIELLAAPFVTNRQPEMVEMQPYRPSG